VTDAEKIATLVRYRLGQADEALTAARLNRGNGLTRSAINRGYYAMFYAVLALLARRQSETSKHAGAIALFDRLFIKANALPREFSRWLHDAFLSRQAADYGSEVTLSREDIETMLSHAAEFVAGVRHHLDATRSDTH
jgi:uncharacterized protein (UPF0332 family)